MSASATGRSRRGELSKRRHVAALQKSFISGPLLNDFLDCSNIFSRGPPSLIFSKNDFLQRQQIIK